MEDQQMPNWMPWHQGDPEPQATTMAGPAHESWREEDQHAPADGQAPDTVQDAPAFPEPLVIGAQPKLRSDLNGLPDDPHKVPDTVLDGADVEGLAIRAASLRGDDHRYYTTTRQDSMDI